MTQIVDATLKNYISESISLVLEQGSVKLAENISASDIEIGKAVLGLEDFANDRGYRSENYAQVGAEYRYQAIDRLLEQIDQFDDREERGCQLMLPIYNNGDENQSWWLDAIYLGDGKFAARIDRPDYNSEEEIVSPEGLAKLYRSALQELGKSMNGEYISFGQLLNRGGAEQSKAEYIDGYGINAETNDERLEEIATDIIELAASVQIRLDYSDVLSLLSCWREEAIDAEEAAV